MSAAGFNRIARACAARRFFARLLLTGVRFPNRIRTNIGVRYQSCKFPRSRKPPGDSNFCHEPHANQFRRKTTRIVVITSTGRPPSKVGS